MIANRKSPIANERLPLAIVVAMARNRCIGRDGGLPWHIAEDLKYFRQVTSGHAILMGRKTWDSIGRPLPNRRNIIISRQAGLAIPGVEVVSDLDAAIRMARAGGDEEPRVVGGGSIYAEALPQATKMYITEVDTEVEGDTYFPAWDSAEWSEASRTRGEDPRVTFVVLVRRS